MSHRHYSIKENEIPEIHPRLLSITLSRDEKDWSSVLHTHPFTEIFFVISGEGRFVFRQEIRTIQAETSSSFPLIWTIQSSLFPTDRWSTMSWESTESRFRKRALHPLHRFSVILPISI